MEAKGVTFDSGPVSRDVVVVGGGIVGSAVAYHCAVRGLDTLLVDRADDGNATDAGAGIVSPATSSRTGSAPWFRFAVEAADYYPELVESLREEHDGPVGYDRPGILAIAAEPAAVDAFETAVERIRERQDRLEAPPEGTIETLSPDEAGELFPPLGPVERAFRYEDAGRVDGRTFADALVQAGEARGLDVRRRSVDRLCVDDEGVEGVRTAGRRVDAESVVVAGGAWSPAFADQLSLEIPVEPERGQIAHLSVPSGVDDWPMVSAFRGHYLVPWPDGRVAAGATRERGTGFDPRATVDGVHEVLGEAVRVAPGLGDAGLDEVRVGLRPTAADRLPIVGSVPGVGGAYLATGHGATGLQLGPYTGRCVAALVAGAEPPADLTAFAPDRFD